MPLVPVCASSSGSADCSSSRENRKPGSSDITGSPPWDRPVGTVTSLASAIDSRSRNHSADFPNTVANTASIDAEGTRLPVSTMLR